MPKLSEPQSPTSHILEIIELQMLHRTKLNAYRLDDIPLEDCQFRLILFIRNKIRHLTFGP